MYWIPPEAVSAWLALHGGVETISGSGEINPTALQWQQRMVEYSEGYASSASVPVNFWLVLSLPGASYSDKLEWHSEAPMLMPVSGEGQLLGLAQTRESLQDMIEKDPANVHLTFKVRIQGQRAWRELIEFLGTHGMIENE